MVLSQEKSQTSLAFAREGGALVVDAKQSHDLIASSCVALHRGRLIFEDTPSTLVRALAVRALRQAMVVYRGNAMELDDELRASCVTLEPRSLNRSEVAYHFAKTRTASSSVQNPSPDVLVEMLRSDPQISGIVEPFVSTLRRRCVEMVAYLALHRSEPVTGDRLRTRVLNYADVDASSRTLANTASAVRKSLGNTHEGPRLHPVSSSGLYKTHGITSDVEAFHTLVARARGVSNVDAASFCQ